MKNRVFFLLFFALIIYFSCGTPKRLIRPDEGLTNVDSLIILANTTYKSLNYLSGKYTLDVSTGRNETSVVANVRYVKDSAIWASVYIIAGVELIRILITPDSVKLIDRLREVYLAESTERIYEFLPFSITFAMVSNIIVPCLSIPQTLKCYNCNNGIRFKWLQNQKAEFQYTSPDGITSHYAITAQGHIYAINYAIGTDKVDISYKKFRTDGNVYIPVRTNLQVQSKDKIKVQISNFKFDVNAPVKMPFKIPNDYKKMDLNVGL